jgi:hypothetical protein
LQNYEQFERGSDGSSDSSWGISEDDPRQKEWMESKSKVSVSYPVSQWGWPRVEGGVEVTIEVYSDIMESENKCPTCRLSILMDHLSVPDLLSSLCHSTIGISIGSCALFSSHRGVD